MRHFLLPSLLLLSGCAALRLAPPDDDAALLAAVEQSWQARGVQGEKPFRDALTRAAESYGQHHPEVAWRRARWRLHQGLSQTEPAQARARFAQARQDAMACLVDEVGFEQRVSGQGWEGALDVLEDQRRVCALWTGLAWARWLETFDVVAARGDFNTATLLLSVGRDGRPELYAWGQGLLGSMLPGSADGERERAHQLLVDLLERQPQSWVVRLDVARHVAIPTGDQALLGRCQAGARRAAPVLPEQRLAARRLVGL